MEHIVEKGKCGLEENFTALWYSMLCCISIRQLHSLENMMFVCAGEVCHRVGKIGTGMGIACEFAKNVLCLCGVRLKSGN